MNQEGFLHQITELLNAAAIPFMVSGSLASSFHGEPRATNDLDLVIDPNAETLNRFVRSLPTEWYVSPDAANAALNRRSVFNVIDTEHGWKADLIVRKDRAFSIREFSRRIPATILGGKFRSSPRKIRYYPSSSGRLNSTLSASIVMLWAWQS